MYGEKYTMERILALTNEKDLFYGIQEKIKDKTNIDIKTCIDNLNLIEKFVSQHTELVILDIDLLNDRVIKLINILRSINKSLKIILILSNDKMSICSHALSLGVVSYLIKPISIDNLTKIITATLKINIQP